MRKFIYIIYSFTLLCYSADWSSEMLKVEQEVAQLQTAVEVKTKPWTISQNFPMKEFVADRRAWEMKNRAKWTKFPKAKDRKVVNLPTPEYMAVFLRRDIMANKKSEVTLNFGSDDGIIIWLNGKRIFFKDVSRPAKPNQDRVLLNLKKGKNQLTMMVHNKTQGSGFWFSAGTTNIQKLTDDLIYGMTLKYPIECDWFNQDSPLNGDLKKGENNDYLRDFREYFSHQKPLEYLRLFIDKAKQELPAAQQKKIDQQVVDCKKKVELLQLYSEVCKQRRQQRLKPLLAKTTQIIFAKHQVFGSKSRILYITETEGCSFPSELTTVDLSPELSGKFATTSTLFDAKAGIARDPEISFDGKRMLFAWRQSNKHIETRPVGVKAPDTGNYQIYEMELATKKIRQLTTDETYGANYEPIYLPNDDIMFSSARIVQHITCGWGDCSNLFVMNKDGKYARRLGFDQTNTNFPALTNDGRVIFTRRDYNDRGQSSAHALFQMRPDGTGQTEMYGNQTGTPNSFTHARAIPGSDKLMCILGGYHTTQGGKLAIMDVTKGRQKAEGLVQIPENVKPQTSDGYNDWYGKQGVQYSNPFPLSETELIVSRSNYHHTGYKVYFMTTDGKREVLAHDPKRPCLQPVPVLKRKRPVVRPSSVDYTKNTGVLFLQDAYFGNAVKGVKPGSIKKIRVVKLLYKYDTIGWGMGQGPGGCWHTVTTCGHPLGTFDAKAVIGDATVYPDGSAMFEVPARTPFYLQLLDKNNRVIQTMRSWATLMPNEMFSCVGCHEEKNESPVMGKGLKPMAMQAGVEKLKPFYGKTRGFSYLEHVQPIFDKHCISCHNPKGKGKELDLRCDPKIKDPDAKKEWARSYYFLTKDRPGPNPEAFACRGKIWNVNGPAKPTEPNKYINWWTRFELMKAYKPYRSGSITSGLIKTLDKGHHKVKLSKAEMEKLCTWIDLNIPYTGNYMDSNTWNKKEVDYHLGKIEERKRNEAIEAENIKEFIKDGQPQ